MEFGPGFLPTFLYYFVGTALLFTLVASKALGLSVETGLPQQVGAVGGVVAGLIGAYFNRTMVFSVPFTNKKTFLNRLESTLTQLGYQLVPEDESSPEQDADPVLVYERSSSRNWLSGKIFVQLDETEKTATIASRAAMIRRLKKELT
jgi:hypothetical protein